MGYLILVDIAPHGGQDEHADYLDEVVVEQFPETRRCVLHVFPIPCFWPQTNGTAPKRNIQILANVWRHGGVRLMVMLFSRPNTFNPCSTHERTVKLRRLPSTMIARKRAKVNHQMIPYLYEESGVCFFTVEMKVSGSGVEVEVAPAEIGSSEGSWSLGRISTLQLHEREREVDEVHQAGAGGRGVQTGVLVERFYLPARLERWM